MAASPPPIRRRHRSRSRSPVSRSRDVEARQTRRRSSSGSSVSSSDDVRVEKKRRRRSRDRRDKGKGRYEGEGEHGDDEKDERRSRKKAGRPEGVSKIDLDDEGQLKSVAPQFKTWVMDRKGKEVDNLESKKRRKYMKKFVKAWNGGELSTELYSGACSIDSAPHVSLTSVPTAPRQSDTTASLNGSSRLEALIGPTSLSSLQYARDAALDEAERLKSFSRATARRERREAREGERDERATGRERLIEKRKEKNEGRRMYEKAKEDAGLEVDEGTLMGSGSNDSFKAAYDFLSALSHRSRY